MASEVDISNMALAHIGDSATVASIDPPEGSAQAEHCRIFYPQARDVLLEMHPWKFNTRRALLTRLAIDTFNWGFAYVEPANTLRVLAVLPSGAPSSATSEEFETYAADDGQSLILTNLEEASVRYSMRMSDSSKFSPLFVESLSWLLASYLAGPVMKGDVGAAETKRCYQVFLTMVAAAKVSDANQRNVDQRNERLNSFAQARL